MEELSYFVGMQVLQENGKVWIGHPTYTDKVPRRYGMHHTKPVDSPVDPSTVV